MSNTIPFFEHKTIEQCISAFGVLFSNYYIQKKEGNKVGHERVPLVYSPREPFLEAIRASNAVVAGDGKSIAIRYPMISYELESISYDSSRQLNPLNKHRGPDQELTFQAVPYNLSFNLTVVSRGLTSLYSIVEQIIPNFTPNYVIRLENYPYIGSTGEISIQQSSINSSDSFEVSAGSRRATSITLNFEMQIEIVGFIRDPAIIRHTDVLIFAKDNLGEPLYQQLLAVGNEDTPENFTVVETINVND